MKKFLCLRLTYAHMRTIIGARRVGNEAEGFDKRSAKVWMED